MTRQYLLGFLLLTAGTIVHALTIPFIDMVLYSTSIATGILMSFFLSVRYLGEKPNWKYDAASIALIVFGILLVVCLSVYDDKTFTRAEINRLMTRAFAIVFLCFYVFVIAVTYMVWQWFFKSTEKFNDDANNWAKSHLIGYEITGTTCDQTPSDAVSNSIQSLDESEH